ncbi:hypothetical protein FEM48_Zijuj05G0131300 [Ziziphus jujuba var. spinosa]|uniref:R13L1/DRL21-like LRR repeat region domain-containing protein n=1 Tax=Ziziphus jujuba var. spinosa TaxID=714518 RepID=A0A978VF04_ZIZJJ|nr:hypothetical protein FEM48_Zijuj05G0131300 [Ziziphus jujuba var. spinosa]
MSGVCSFKKQRAMLEVAPFTIFTGSLEALPEDIWKLVNLRHLYTESPLRPIQQPRGLSQLTNLQTLTEFQVKAEHGGQLNELRDLNNLRGNLKIEVHEDGIKSEGANLKSKQHLQSIELRIHGKMVDDCGDLVPHSNIKKFTLYGPYPGAALLNCVPSLKNLVEFRLKGHKECQSIAALNHLPHLKSLKLTCLEAVEYISSAEYDDNVDDSEDEDDSEEHQLASSVAVSDQRNEDCRRLLKTRSFSGVALTVI